MPPGRHRERKRGETRLDDKASAWRLDEEEKQQPKTRNNNRWKFIAFNRLFAYLGAPRVCLSCAEDRSTRHGRNFQSPKAVTLRESLTFAFTPTVWKASQVSQSKETSGGSLPFRFYFPSIVGLLTEAQVCSATPHATFTTRRQRPPRNLTNR